METRDELIGCDYLGCNKKKPEQEPLATKDDEEESLAFSPESQDD